VATATSHGYAQQEAERGAEVVTDFEPPAVAVLADDDRAGQHDPRTEYVCECGHRLLVYGGGRHRVYFEPEDLQLDNPVMDRACPACGRGLPGKNRP